MKWFKHYSNATSSNSLTRLLSEQGIEGYGRYWRLLELMAEKFDGDETHFDFITPALMGHLGIYHFKVLTMFAECLNNVGLMSIKCDRKLTSVSSSILLELQSRDFKQARAERADTAPKNKIENKSKEEEKEVEPPANLGALDALFSGRIGEHTYKRISPQTKQVWLELYGSDLNFIARSFISAFAKWSSRLPKDQGVPDTFFTTQLQYDWPHHVRHKSKNQKTEPSGGLLTDWADEKEA